MFDFDIPTEYSPLLNGNLDDRRPRLLSEIVGQNHFLPRLAQAARNGVLARRYAFIGPTGAGKTTVATTVARIFLCTRSRELGDACGECRTCRLANLPDHGSYHEWTGAQLDESWGWWIDEGRHILERPTWCFFLDEVQDLSAHHQKALFRQLESARAMVLFATTHEHLINDALMGRFGTNKFEVRRPSLEEAVHCMERHCHQLGVTAARHHLSAVAQHYAHNLRLCVDFVYSVKDQTPDGRVTNDFVMAVTGIAPTTAPATPRNRISL